MSAAGPIPSPVATPATAIDTGGSGEPMHQFVVVEEHDGDTIVQKWTRRRMPAGSAQGGAAPADAQRAADQSHGEGELYRGPARDVRGVSPSGRAIVIRGGGDLTRTIRTESGKASAYASPGEAAAEILALAAERDAARAEAEGLRAEVATLRAELATLRANAQDPGWLRHHLGLLTETPWAELTARAGEFAEDEPQCGCGGGAGECQSCAITGEPLGEGIVLAGLRLAAARLRRREHESITGEPA